MDVQFDPISSSVISAASIGTTWIVLSSVWNKRSLRPHSSAAFYANFLFAATVAYIWVAHRLSIPYVNVIPFLFDYVITGGKARHCLLLFWLICLSASVIFMIAAANQTQEITTVHRKFFHLTVSLIAVAGLQYDPQLTTLAVVLVACAFACIECIRSLQVQPFAGWLDGACIVFLDEQDSHSLILTPFYLLVGVFSPLFLSPAATASQVTLKHFAGVATVGVGDSMAAICGRRFGRTKWPGSRKSVEGSLALVVSQSIALLLAIHLLKKYELLTFGYFCYILLGAFVCAIVEGVCRSADNIILPFVGYWFLR
uniref:dolichol kinase n=1 Tax=Plectus sambesii TaxID=2011161 RepID=A0A914VTJ5_9BILA